MKKSIILLMAAIVALALVPAQAEEVPFSTNVTVTAGSGSYTYPAAGIKKPYGEAIKVQVVLTPSTATTTNTITLVSGSTTNAVATKVAAANDNDTSLTQSHWLFAGDDIIITSTDTNTFTATLIGVEQ